jgi:hypothetical protein
MMSPVFVVIGLVIGIVVAAGGLRVALWGPHARARRRLAEGRAQIADRSIVTLRGRVKPPASPLIAPLSGRTCVAYEAVARYVAPVEEQVFMLQRPDIAERAMIAFDLELGGEVVRVEGDRAELSLTPAAVIPRKLEREEAFVAKFGHPVAESRCRTSLETVVEPGSLVTVHGMALVEMDPGAAVERGYRDAPTRVRIVAHTDHPLTIGVPR